MMILSRKSNQLLARVNFPPYTVHCITERHILVAGGGGGAKTGIPNVIEIYEITCHPRGFKAKSVTHYMTGQHAIMNSTVFNAGNYFMVFTGMDEMCQIYKLKFKMEKQDRIPNGFINNEDLKHPDVRHRRRSKSQNDEDNEDNRTSDSTNSSTAEPVNILFDLKPIQSFQTDFSIDPFQKVVKFSASKILATGGSDGYLRVWKYPALNKLYEIEAHSKDVDDLDFSPLGDRIVTVSRDGHGKIWDAEKGTLICSLQYEIPKTQQKYLFRNCRFSAVEGSKTKTVIFISLNAAVRKKPPSQCCLTKWNGQSYSIEKLVFVGTEMLSTMAISEDGNFIGLGTQEGSVRIYIAFSLQLLYRADHVHNIFVTGLDFMKPCKVSRQILGGYETSLVSISVDNHINIHYIPHRPTIGLFGLVIFFIITLFVVFLIMDYFNL